MWLMHNFVITFKDQFHRILDQEYSPNAGTAMGEEIREKMVEPISILSKRRETIENIKKIKVSLHDIDTVNRLWKSLCDIPYDNIEILITNTF